MKFNAKVIEDIPANRLIGLGGVNSEDNIEEGWETVYLIKSRLGWIPDLVSTKALEQGEVVEVTIKNEPIWHVETAERLPAGTVVQCTEDGRVKHYVPADGNHIGYTTHSVEVGEIATIVRKYGTMPQSQETAMAFKSADENDLNNLTANELKGLLEEKNIEYKANATKKELIELLGGD